jgi:rubrerythrin
MVYKEENEDLKPYHCIQCGIYLGDYYFGSVTIVPEDPAGMVIKTIEGSVTCPACGFENKV